MQLLSLSTIHRTVKPGVKGDRANGVAAVKPEVQEVPKGVRFTPLTKQEQDELLKLGAARRQNDMDDWENIPVFKKDGELEAPKSDEELAAEQAALDAQEQRRRDAAARVRAAAEAKAAKDAEDAAAAAEKQRQDDEAAAELERQRLAKEAEDRKAREQADADAQNQGGGKGEEQGGEKPKTAAKGKSGKKAADSEDDVV